MTINFEICPIIKKECSVNISCENCFIFNEYSEIDVNDEYVIDELIEALNCFDDDDVITFVNDFLEDDDEILF